MFKHLIHQIDKLFKIKILIFFRIQSTSLLSFDTFKALSVSIVESK